MPTRLEPEEKLFQNAVDPSRINGEIKDDTIEAAQKIIDSSNTQIKNSAEGIVRINNTSYSGADIKVLVHKYKTPAIDQRGDLMSVISVYERVVVEIDELMTIVIPGMTEIIRIFGKEQPLNNAVTDAIASYRSKVLKIIQIESEIKDTGYFQFIGNSLSNTVNQALRDPSSLNENLFQTLLYIRDFIDGWKQQADAIGAMSSELISTKVLAELQTISISSFREKNAVRAFGSVSPKGFVRGNRTLAGSMIFTVFDRNVLFELLDISDFAGDVGFKSAIKDQLPPMDVTISFANELGALSRMTIYGLEFVSEGQSMSIEDIILEDVCQFVCRDFDPLTPVLNDNGEPYNVLLNNFNQARVAAKSSSFGGAAPVTASSLIGSDFNKSNPDENAAAARFKARNNPFR